VCARGLELDERRLVCGDGHSFDVARGGYVNLLPSGTDARHEGDTADMVGARERFLAAGHFAPLARAVTERAGEFVAQSEAAWVADLGAATGYYLGEVLDALEGCAGVALDASKFAARRAARAHPRAGAVVCDIWQALPLRDASIRVALNIFAPRNGREFRRVLDASGALLVVTPSAHHLQELAGPAGLLSVDERKEERLLAELEPELAPVAKEPLEFELRLERDDARSLIQMGPTARHLGAGDLDARLDAMSWPLTATAAVAVWTFRPVG
jgi:23S rRNA (guanine745-N1)-methyltransferase